MAVFRTPSFGNATNMSEPIKRITFKRNRPNPLFQEWLEELYEDAKTNRSKLESMLKEALTSLSKYPLPLRTGAECAVLKGFDRKLCIFLDRRLEVVADKLENRDETEQCDINTNSTDRLSISSGHNNNYGTSEKPQFVQRNLSANVRYTHNVQYNVDSASGSSNKTCTETSSSLAFSGSSTGNNSSQIDMYIDSKPQENPRHEKKSRIYKPSHGSGGYAILRALLEISEENKNTGKLSISKEILTERAQKYSEESFTRPKPDSHYTAWSSMTRLINKGLVQKCKNNKKVEYELTASGILLAKELLKESVSIPAINDVIFNNMDTGNLDLSTSQSNSSNISENNMNLINIDEETIIMTAGSFDVILVIDKMETSGVSKKNDPTVAQFNKYPDLKHEYRSLKVGDYTWIARDKQNNQELVLPYIVERKRMDDFGASIKDGRFHEQKFRLRNCGLANVIYMIENFGSNKFVGLPMQNLKQAMCNTRVQDGFKVHVTDSLSNSARFLAMMTRRLTIKYKDTNLIGCNNGLKNDALMTFKYFNTSSAKTKPLTVTETFIKLLLQLKGLSVEKAVAITNVYRTPSSLIQQYQKCGLKEGEFLLANLTYGELNRKVGPTVSKSVYQLFSKSF